MRIWKSSYMFLFIWKQNPENFALFRTFHVSHVRISQKVKSVLMWNLQQIIFIRKQSYGQIFKSALVYFKIYDPMQILQKKSSSAEICLLS